MGESSAETADISAGAESRSAAHNLARLLQPCNARIWQPLQRNAKDLSQFTVPAEGDQSKQTPKTPATHSKSQPLCTTFKKSQPVENMITRVGWLSKPPGYLKKYA